MFVRVFGLKVKLAWNVLAKTLNRFSLTSLSSAQIKLGAATDLYTTYQTSQHHLTPYSRCGYELHISIAVLWTRLGWVWRWWEGGLGPWLVQDNQISHSCWSHNLNIAICSELT